MEDVAIVTMSEFGRTVEENGAAGTDHGHGSMMMVLGGPVQRGRFTASGRGWSKTVVCRCIGKGSRMNPQYRTSLRAALTAVSLAAATSFCPTARGQESKVTGIMPAAQQNAVIGKYCASCHNDVLMYGGLSVQHFDAARPEPGVAAMLVSKLTAGQSPDAVKAALHGPDSQATILGFMKTGAMGAGGIGVPDETTQAALVKALSVEAAGAEEWDSRLTEKPPAESVELIASIVRQLPSTKFAGKTDMYRLIVTCRVATHEGEIKLAWANGVPEEGREMTVAVDGKAPFTHRIEGGKKQGNGTNGPGATVLYPNPQTNMPLPARSLTIKNVFPDETVVFPFENLSQTVRRDLSACFNAGDKAY
jgi:hypothetical protein